MFTFAQHRLVRQFVVVSIFVFFGKTVFVGSWASQQIEVEEMSRFAAVTSLNVGSLISPHLQTLSYTDQLNPDQIASLKYVYTQTPFGEQLIAYNLWGPDGRIIYSDNPDITGQQFPLTDNIKQTFRGDVKSEVSKFVDFDNRLGQGSEGEFVKTYVPVFIADTGDIVASLELFQRSDEILPKVRTAQLWRWLGVGITMASTSLFLIGIVAWSSKTMTTQQVDLEMTVEKLQKLLIQNKKLNNRVRGAAARTTALNEKFLARISADLHDGPGQDLGLALLRIEGLTNHCPHCPPALSKDIYTIQTALDSALNELRTISAGLRIPQINNFSPAETAHRAIRDYERKTRCPVELVLGNLPDNSLPVPVNITLYRVVQEALSNGFRHAEGIGQIVRIDRSTDILHLEVTDNGPGFNPTVIPTNSGRLGLAGMSERVRILGGCFEVDSVYGEGTTVKVDLPLIIPEADNV